MYPSFSLHPALTTLPSAMILSIFVLECLHLYPRSSRWRQHTQAALPVLHVLACLGVGAAFFSGYSASERANQSFCLQTDPIEWHHLCGRALLFLYPAVVALFFTARSAQYSRRLFQGLYLMGLLVSTMLVAYTAYLGGELVFSHGAGVLVESVGKAQCQI
jgi:uncharacterized membrane protein